MKPEGFSRERFNSGGVVLWRRENAQRFRYLINLWASPGMGVSFGAAYTSIGTNVSGLIIPLAVIKRMRNGCSAKYDANNIYLATMYSEAVIARLTAMTIAACVANKTQGMK